MGGQAIRVFRWVTMKILTGPLSRMRWRHETALAGGARGAPETYRRHNGHVNDKARQLAGYCASQSLNDGDMASGLTAGALSHVITTMTGIAQCDDRPA
ncbi:hypothetical protein PIN31009_03212 [Pandoraea iniqua]|nr:hypothetical protein PIN31009_03212 [Pandoraea iniqua]